MVGKGIFRKLFMTYIAILAVVIIVLSLSLSQFFKIYFFNSKQKELTTIGKQVETELIRYRRGDITEEMLRSTIDTIGRSANTRITVIESSKPEELSEESELKSGLQIDLKKILNGETVVKRHEYSTDLNTYVVAVGIPIHTTPQQKGALLLFSPVYEVNNALVEVYKIIWFTALLALAGGFAVIWATSRKLSGPVIKLSEAAQRIANQENVPDLEEEADGEIGLLVQSFNYMKNRLIRTEKMRREFIAGVSHELRTPLTSMRGYIQAIIDGLIPEAQQIKYLELAFNENKRLTLLTNDLLELTKIESGAVVLKKTQVKIKKILEESLLIVRENYGNSEMACSLTVEPEDLEIGMDPDRGRQIFINLLDNAFKYALTPAEVHITARCAEEGHIIEIKDTGPGIPEQELGLIFEKFHRVDKSRDEAVGGYGLGLSIVKELVELHQGQILVSSREGLGSCFKIIFP